MPASADDHVVAQANATRSADRIAGTLVKADELPYWHDRDVQYLYVHSDPFLRVGLNGIRKTPGN